MDEKTIIKDEQLSLDELKIKYDNFTKEILQIKHEIEIHFENYDTMRNYMRALEKRVGYADETIYYTTKKQKDKTYTVIISPKPLNKKQNLFVKYDWIIKNLNEYGNCVLPPKLIKRYGLNNLMEYIVEVLHKEITVREVEEWNTNKIIHIAEVKEGKNGK